MPSADVAIDEMIVQRRHARKELLHPTYSRLFDFAIPERATTRGTAGLALIASGIYLGGALPRKLNGDRFDDRRNPE